MWKEIRWKNIIVVLIVTVFSAASFFAIKSRVEKNELKVCYESMSTNSAIEVGRAYADSLLGNYPYLIDGTNKELSDVSTGGALVKLGEKNKVGYRIYAENELADIYLNAKNRGVSMSKISSLFPRKKNLELASLSRDDNKIRLEFIYLDDFRAPVLIYDNEKMIFDIDLEYIWEKDKLKGRWFVSSFDYGYNINDYVKWISSL